MKHREYLLIVAASACCAPPTAPSAQTDADAGAAIVSASACGRACIHLRDLGCPEGQAKTCTAACQSRAELVGTPVTCWLEAGTQDAARACGGLRCTDP